jgi:hypothetical protein
MEEEYPIIREELMLCSLQDFVAFFALFAVSGSCLLVNQRKDFSRKDRKGGRKGRKDQDQYVRSKLLRRRRGRNTLLN